MAAPPIADVFAPFRLGDIAFSADYSATHGAFKLLEVEESVVKMVERGGVP